MFVAQHFQTGHQSQLSCQPVNLCEMWTMMVSTVYTVHCSNVVLPDFGTSRVRTLDIHIFIIDHRIRVKSRLQTPFCKISKLNIRIALPPSLTDFMTLRSKYFMMFTWKC